MRIPLFVLSLAATFVVASYALAVTVEQVPNPRHQGSWVTDEAGMLSAQSERRIDEEIDRLEGETGVEIAVVTVDTVAAATPRDFATQLFNHWGIGKAGEDNGLLILMVESERRLEMETGYGLEPVLTDGWLKQMQQDEMVPHFRQGDFDTGLVDGVEVVADRVREHQEYIGAATAAPYDDGGNGSGLGYGVFGLIVLLVIGGLYIAGRRMTTCPDCEVSMIRKPIEALDQVPHLSRGQELEHALGSVRHDIYECPECDHHKVLSNRRWFDGHIDCSDCGYRTVSVNRTTVRRPTYTRQGRREVTETCHHDECGRVHEYTQPIPRRTRSSGSSSGGGFSSGGGGSFGGGSSGGGGAGSSW